MIEFMPGIRGVMEDKATSRCAERRQEEVSRERNDGFITYSRSVAGHGSISFGVNSVLYIVVSSNGADERYA